MVDFFQNLDIQYLLSTYGYLAVLILTFLEGETIVILAGIAASQGLLDPVLIALSAFAGSCTSDQFMFSLGKYKGPSILQRFPSVARNVDRASVLIKKYDVLLILGFRFVYGVRNITPIMLGISNIPHIKFLALNIIGAAVWAASFTAGGYYLAHAFSKAVESFGHVFFYVLVVIGVLAGVIFFIRSRQQTKEAKKLAEKGRTVLQQRQQIEVEESDTNK